MEKRVLGIAYETVEGTDGAFPLLRPMSQIACRLSSQTGAYFLQSQHGGSGVLLGGIPGTMPGHVVVVGAGNSGAHAVQMAAGMGARVTVLGLAQATEPFVALLVRRGVERALAEHAGLAKGVNTRAGRIVYPAVAAALGFSE
ncbi:MAG: hypothetical protein ACKOTE_19280 [Opitutaceae bacterium]